MALGRQGERQTDLLVDWAGLPRSEGHASYDRQQATLIEAGFDDFAEEQCAPLHASKRVRPSLPPDRHFWMPLVGYFEGIDSEWSFALILDRIGMRRVWLCGRESLHKRYLVHVAGHNLGLIIWLVIGAGTPRELLARVLAHLLALTRAEVAAIVILAVAVATDSETVIRAVTIKPTLAL